MKQGTSKKHLLQLWLREGTKHEVEQKLQDRDAAGVHLLDLYLVVDCGAGGIFMRSKAELSSFVSTCSNPVSLGLPRNRRSSAELNGRVSFMISTQLY